MNVILRKLKRLDTRLFGDCDHKWQNLGYTYSGEHIFRESGFRHYFKCFFCGKKMWRYPTKTPPDSEMYDYVAK